MQNLHIMGLSGHQLQAMQGGKLKNADQYPGYPQTDDYKAKRLAENQRRAALQEELLQTALSQHPKLKILFNAITGLPISYLLQAAHEIEVDMDDTLLVDLARIHGVNLGTDPIATSRQAGE